MKLFSNTVLFIVLLMFATSSIVYTKTESFTGRVISVSDTTIELKKGSDELIIKINQDTKISKGKALLSIADLKICQLIKVQYSSDKELLAQKIEIIEESYCTK